MTTYLVSTFSPGMLKDKNYVSLNMFEHKSSDIKGLLKQPFVSGIGHPGTLQLMSQILDLQLPVVDPTARVKVEASRGDTFVVFQYTGPRLAEGQILSAEEVEAANASGHFTWLTINVASLGEV